MTLKEFNNKYQYKTDKERFNTSLDIWELPKDSDIIRADCEIGKRLNYNGKLWKINYSRGWENQELVYGLFQGLFFNYVIITNIIN